MDKQKIPAAVAQMSDICAAAAGDMHTLHLNMHGAEFDTMHKKVLLKYYEQLDDDYDELAEFAACYGWECKNKNESAERVSWKSFEGMVNRATAVKHTDTVLNTVTSGMLSLFNSLNKITDCPISVGVANWLQGRLEYWSKEQNYFNRRRFDTLEEKKE
jgi:DNA-binding ferritin-like protein